MWRTGGLALLQQLREDEALMSNPSAKVGLEEMDILFTYLAAYKVVDKVSPHSLKPLL